MVDDLITAYLEKQDDTYFCGSLVLVKNEADKRFDIIDGQQRITTFIIMSCVFRDDYSEQLNAKAKDYVNESIRDKYKDTKQKINLLTDEQHQVDFETTVLNGIATKNDGSFKHNQYLKNAHLLKDFFKKVIKEHEIDIDKFVEWYFEQVVLTVIICPSEDDAIRIFNVLNARGMPLSSVDILKSSLMQQLDKESREGFKSTWDGIKNKLETIEHKLDDMFNNYLYYKIATNPKKRLDQELLAHFKKEEENNAIEIIKEIDGFSNHYIEILSLENKYLYCLIYLKHQIYWRSILVTARFVDYEEQETLKQLLVAFYYQNWIAGATTARIKQTSFNILKHIKDKKNIDVIKSEMRDNLEYYSTTKAFKEAINGNYVYDSQWAKPILLLIEYFSTDDINQNYIELNRKLNVEHILPQEPKDDYWQERFDEDELYKWTNSLANLTLLSMRKNIQAANYSFAKKKEAYQNKDNVITSFLMTQEIANNDQWTVKELEERQAKLLGKVMGKLDLF